MNFDGKIVAVVDDQQVVLEGMSGLLETYGAKVLAYKSGHDLLRELPFVHCLVVDYLMPGLNGLDLVLELRKCGYGAPAIVLTAMIDQVSNGPVIEAGISALVDKYSGYDAILQAIDAALLRSGGIER